MSRNKTKKDEASDPAPSYPDVVGHLPGYKTAMRRKKEEEERQSKKSRSQQAKEAAILLLADTRCICAAVKNAPAGGVCCMSCQGRTRLPIKDDKKTDLRKKLLVKNQQRLEDTNKSEENVRSFGEGVAPGGRMEPEGGVRMSDLLNSNPFDTPPLQHQPQYHHSQPLHQQHQHPPPFQQHDQLSQYHHSQHLQQHDQLPQYHVSQPPQQEHQSSQHQHPQYPPPPPPNSELPTRNHSASRFNPSIIAFDVDEEEPSADVAPIPIRRRIGDTAMYPAVGNVEDNLYPELRRDFTGTIDPPLQAEASPQVENRSSMVTDLNINNNNGSGEIGDVANNPLKTVVNKAVISPLIHFMDFLM